MTLNLQIEEAGWENEGNFLEFKIRSTRGLIIRNQIFGTLCGYLSPRDPSFLEVLRQKDIHGGWTYDSSVNPWTGEEDRFHWLGFDCAHSSDLFALPASNFHRALLDEISANDPEKASEIKDRMSQLFESLNSLHFSGGEPSYKTMEFVRAELHRAHEAAVRTLKNQWKGVQSEISVGSQSGAPDHDLEL